MAQCNTRYRRGEFDQRRQRSPGRRCGEIRPALSRPNSRASCHEGDPGPSCLSSIQSDGSGRVRGPGYNVCRARRSKRDPTACGLQPADAFDLIRWLARSQSDPRKAVAELVQNAIDANARTIAVERRPAAGARR